MNEITPRNPTNVDAPTPEKAYADRAGIQSLLPYKRPQVKSGDDPDGRGTRPVYVRSKNGQRVQKYDRDGAPVREYTELVAHTAYGSTVTLHSPEGIPYGMNPRLLMAYVENEAKKQYKQYKQGKLDFDTARTISLGDTLNEFLTRVGLSNGGRQYAQMMEQATRISALTIHESKSASNSVAFLYQAKNVKPVSEIQLWVLGNDAPDQQSLFPSYVKLDSDWFKEIGKNAFPYDMTILKKLVESRSPLAIDVFLWATHAVYPSARKQGIRLGWPELMNMFGSFSPTPQGRKNFKRNFRAAIEKVADSWPGFTYKLDKDGLYLPPQKPSIAPRRSNKGKDGPVRPSELPPDLAKGLATLRDAGTAPAEDTPSTQPTSRDSFPRPESESRETATTPEEAPAAPAEEAPALLPMPPAPEPEPEPILDASMHEALEKIVLAVRNGSNVDDAFNAIHKICLALNPADDPAIARRLQKETQPYMYKSVDASHGGDR